MIRLLGFDFGFAFGHVRIPFTHTYLAALSQIQTGLPLVDKIAKQL